MYIADSFNHRVRKVTVSTGIITTIAGTGGTTFSGDGGDAASASLYFPGGIAVDASGTSTTIIPACFLIVSSLFNIPTPNIGNVYIADSQHYRIRKVTIATPYPRYVHQISCIMYHTYYIRLSTTPSVSPSTQQPSRAPSIVPTSAPSINIIITIAGTGASSYSGDGAAASSAALYYPHGVTTDSSGIFTASILFYSFLIMVLIGNVYIADTYNCRIRKVTVSTGIITTIVGTGASSFSGDSGQATSATLHYPTGIALDTSGILTVFILIMMIIFI